MKNTDSIIVVIDPKHDNNPVIRRAKEFAKVTNSSLHLLVCSDSKKAEKLLNNTVNSLQESGLQISSEIAWHENYHKTIVTVQKQQNSMLVIKTHLPDNILKRAIITPQDWKLLRVCPCPILIVNQDKPWANRPVLAAVDLGSSDKNHIELHNTLVDVAETLTYVAKGTSLHLVSVYPSPIFAEIHPDSKIHGMTSEIKQFYIKACDSFEKAHPRLNKENIHLLAGAADVIIPQVAKDLDASVCVIGNMGRTGASGALMGNTAEAILDDLDCDLLIIKPDSITEALEELMKQILAE